MPARQSFTHAVIMGDLVKSEEAASVSHLHKAFNDAVRHANSRYKSRIASPLTITLGDEFQGLTTSLTAGLHIMQNVRIHLLSMEVKCRFVLGLVRIETDVNPNRAWNMMGPGLATAREKLSDKRSLNAYRFSLPREAVTETLLDAIGFSITQIEARWTARQFEIVRRSLTTKKPAYQLAETLNVVPRVLRKIKSAAQLDFYENQWKALNAGVESLDQRYKLTR